MFMYSLSKHNAGEKMDSFPTSKEA
jgi:hypothetical protein